MPGLLKGVLSQQGFFIEEKFHTLWLPLCFVTMMVGKNLSPECCRSGFCAILKIQGQYQGLEFCQFILCNTSI